LLGRAERAGEVVVAPPHGLTLLDVRYPPDDKLAARATEARARRAWRSSLGPRPVS
jgi:tRNA pseudouridine38-40 synthase